MILKKYAELTNKTSQAEQLTIINDFFAKVKDVSNNVFFYKGTLTNIRGELDYQKDLKFFLQDESAQEIFKLFINKDWTGFEAIIKEKLKSPFNYINKNFVFLQVTLASYFNTYEYTSDEVARVQNSPIGFNLFMKFITLLKVRSKGVILLPTPPKSGSELIDTEEVYDGFIDPHIGAAMFNNFLAFQVLLKEQESLFLEHKKDFEESLKQVLNNPSMFIRDIYLNNAFSNGSLENEENNTIPWEVRATRGTQ